LEENMEKPMPYRVYLIRAWPTRRGGVADCRVSLENVTSGERKHFADLKGLLTFLEAQRVEWEHPGEREAAEALSETSHTAGRGKEVLA
jgi:hypothetical protein